MTIHIGVSGTRHGMTEAQRFRVAYVLDSEILDASKHGHGIHVHHGDCVGADAEFHAIARERQLWVVGHPPDLPGMRANCEFNERRDPGPYRARNQDIVDECALLIAAPARVTPGDRSGTWQTIRMAVKKGKPVIVVGPNGDVHLM